MEEQNNKTGGRRSFLQSTVAAASSTAVSSSAQEAGNWLRPAKATYWNEARGIRIFPGEWRPHYPWEHIVWISPAWPCQDYMWLDFPEVIFSNEGLLFSSHNHPSFPTVFQSMHADPRFKDLNPGESTSIHGKLIFFNGKLDDFDYRKA